MNTREIAKAMMSETNPNFCNDLRACETGECKNYTDEECLDWWVRGMKEILKQGSK